MPIIGEQYLLVVVKWFKEIKFVQTLVYLL
jgi:hypothetical protein